jgi:hypothetical protein
MKANGVASHTPDGGIVLGNGKTLKPFDQAVLEKSTKVNKKNGVISRIRFLELDQRKPGTLEMEKIQRWCRVEDFNPSSSHQLIKYLKWRIKDLSESVDLEKQKLAKLYYVPKRYKDGKDTTSSKELKELYEKTGDPLLAATMEYRSVCTNLNNYYPNWKPNPLTGSVHTTFGFVPPGGQLNSIEPNCQNLSKHTWYGQIFRRMVEAKPGHVFVEFDKSRFHVAMMGREALSPRYIRFAKLDSHSIFTSWIAKEKSLEVDLDHDSDEVAKAKIKEIKSRFKEIRDLQAKPAVLGNQLGLGARKMHFMNRKGIPTIRHAEMLQKKLAEQFPEVERYKEMITTLAYNQRYLITPFGYIRHFYDVLQNKWNRGRNEWELKHGDDFEKALALNIQSNSFCQMKTEWACMIKEHDAFEKFGFINTIHDSNMFHPTIKDLQGCAEKVFRVMMGPCWELRNGACPEGLVVGVGVTIGKNLQDWYDKKDGKKPYNPEGMREVNVFMKDGEVVIDWPRKGMEYLQ